MCPLALQISKDCTLGFDPTCVSYFPTGEFAIITGSSKKVYACTYMCVHIIQVVQYYMDTACQE